jgi:PKD repeat protein
MRFILIIYLLNASLTCFCQNPPRILDLKSWLTADSSKGSSSLVDTLIDISGNYNHAYQNQYTKKPIKNFSPQLNNHSSFSLDGIDDFLLINDDSTLDFDTTFSINIIFKPNSLNLAFKTLFAKWDAGSFPGSFVFQTSDPQYFELENYILNNTSDVGSNYNKTQGLNLTDSIFIVLTINYEGNQAQSVDRLKTYKNGIFINSNLTGLIPQSILPSNSPITIGSFGNNVGRYFNADFLEILIYNSSLNATEINNLYEYVENKYAPKINIGQNITINNNYCSTLLSTPYYFRNYLWSTGDTTSTISVNRSGTYWVKATNIFGKESSDTIVVQFPVLRLPLQNQFCQNQSLLWNSQLSNQLFNFQWSDASTDSLLSISQPGDYYVTVTDSFGCSITSDTITITQDNFSTTASLGPDTSLCAGNRIGIITGNQPGLSYLWSNSATDSALVVTNSGQYIVSVTNQNNCVAKDTINVTISGQAPIAGFENTPTCLNTNIQFTDTSRVTDGSTINQWFWDFGNTTILADTSILTNPSYTFPDTGSYQITLRVKSSQGCSQSIQKNIRVFPKPIVDYYTSIACQNDTTSFFSTINALGYPTNSVTWNFGDPTSGNNNQSSLANSTHVFSQTGNYQIKLTAENNKQCKDSITKIISVKNEVSANFNFNTACVGSPITFSDNSIVPAPNTQNVRLWNFYPGSSGGLSVNKTYPSAGTYSVTLTVNGYNGCISSITKKIEVHLPPIADFASDTICKNDTVMFQDLSLPQQGNLSSWQWKLNNQLIAQVQQPTYVFNSSDNFNLKLITQNSFGCKDSISKNITVYSLPNATISSNADPYYFIGEPVQFNTSSTDFSSYVWLIDSINTFTVAQPTFTFNSSGDYSIQLTVEDSLGCSAKGNKTVSVASRILDAAVQQALASVDTFGFVKVTAELHNLGTSPITAFDIVYEITGTEKVKESWAGSFPPNSILQYTFNREVYLEEFQQKNALNCIRVLSVNSKQDVNLNNNQSCSSLINNENFVADPFPNPSKNKFTIPVNLKEAQSIQIEVKDVLGKSLLNEKTNGNKGINFIQLNAEKWESGIYFLNIIINESTFFQKKIIKN